MTIVTEIVNPILTAVFVGGFGLWILFLIYKGIKKISPNFNFVMKYKVFRFKYNEKVVEWCMNAISRDMNYIDAQKFLLVKGVKPKKMKEVMYIYDQVLNNSQGGVLIKNEQFRQSNEQTQLPKIS